MEPEELQKVELTTEQDVDFTFELDDWKGKPLPIDGEPVLVVSDETIGRVSVVNNGNGSWTGNLRGLTVSPEGTVQRVVITMDAAPGDAVDEVIGAFEFTVKFDDRTTKRTLKITLGIPKDAA